eukprot:12908686-Prorocentrum_lima.AAC.1
MWPLRLDCDVFHGGVIAHAWNRVQRRGVVGGRGTSKELHTINGTLDDIRQFECGNWDLT